MSTLPSEFHRSLAHLIVASFANKKGPAANGGTKTNNQGDSTSDSK